MKQFGLIGKSLSHSWSSDYFKKKFIAEGHSDWHYETFEFSHLTHFRDWVKAHDRLVGLNVTTPYKVEIIQYLDEIDTLARQVGAVNTICIIRNAGTIRLIGFNTDAWGFEKSLPDDLPDGHALILGTGGAARAVSYALNQRGIPLKMVSRKPAGPDQISYTDIDKALISHCLIIINATPVGMYPHMEDFPAIPYQWLTPDHFLYDLIYNPPQTRFLQLGKQSGCRIMNGLRMLYLQAEKSWEIWKTYL